jgi:hypothetical protein
MAPSLYCIEVIVLKEKGYIREETLFFGKFR